jgi:LytS/YehU family sensor histidine kinase
MKTTAVGPPGAWSVAAGGETIVLPTLSGMEKASAGVRDPYLTANAPAHTVLPDVAAVVILAVLFLALLGDRLDRSFWAKSIVFGIVFGATGVTSMTTPVEFAPGFFADGRNVVMAFAGAIGGPVSAIITAGILSGMRTSLGGAGLVSALAGIWLVGAGSSAVWGWLRARGHQRLAPKHVLVLATMAALLPPLALLVLGDAPNDDVFRNLVALIVPTNFIGVLLLGFLIINEQQRRWAVSAYLESQAQLQATPTMRRASFSSFQSGQMGSDASPTCPVGRNEFWASRPRR